MLKCEEYIIQYQSFEIHAALPVMVNENNLYKKPFNHSEYIMKRFCSKILKDLVWYIHLEISQKKNYFSFHF